MTAKGSIADVSNIFEQIKEHLAKLKAEANLASVATNGASSMDVDGEINPDDFVREVFTQCLLDVGHKSFSHSLVFIERYLSIMKSLNALPAAKYQTVCIVADYWYYKPEMMEIILDKLVNYGVIDSPSLISWALSIDVLEEGCTRWYQQTIMEKALSKLRLKVSQTRIKLNAAEEELRAKQEAQLKDGIMQDDSADEDGTALEVFRNAVNAAEREQREAYLNLFQKFKDTMQLRIQTDIANDAGDTTTTYWWRWVSGFFRKVVREFEPETRSMLFTMDNIVFAEDTHEAVLKLWQEQKGTMMTDLLPTQLEASDILNAEDGGSPEASHFEEYNTFIRGVTVLKSSLDPGIAVDSVQLDRILATLTHVLAKYQEQPHLLDPHLEEIIQPLIIQLRISIASHASSPSSNPKSNQTCMHRTFRLLSSLTKVRGYKTVIKFFTHDVSDLEPVLNFLTSLDAKDPEIWETRYILLLWLSLIAMIPFDLKTVDSGLAGGVETLMDRLIRVGREYLGATGKEYEGGGVLLTRLLTRRDMASTKLHGFIDWAMEVLRSSNDTFLLRGVLRCLGMILKASPRSFVLPLIPSLSPSFALMNDPRVATNALLRKMVVKVTQRIGLTLLKPRAVSWRYQRGSRSLSHNLSVQPIGPNIVAEQSVDEAEDEIPQEIEEVVDLLLNGLRDKDTVVRWSAAKGIGRISDRLPQDFAQEITSSVLSLFTEDTFTAPGTNQISLVAVSDATWHGACLAIAELARRGLLLPTRLDEIMPWIVKAIVFDQRRGAHSVGAHVRDAACYVCWSFARAYAPETMRPYVAVLAKALVVESVFDREINIRRASSAAFQENVGRQGIFPHGIDIVTLADYFTVGNRNHSFLEISVEVSKFEEYRHPLVDHLVNVSTQHWDRAIREVASKALYRLTKLDLEYALSCLPSLISRTTQPDAHIRHGALLAVGEICLAWSETRHSKKWWTDEEYQDLIKPISAIVGAYPSEFLESFGSDLTRSALCRFIMCLSEADWPRNVEIPNKGSLPCVLWNVVSSTLERREAGLQEVAARAVTSMTIWDAMHDASTAETIMKQYTANVAIKVNPIIRRGYALALGALPAAFLIQEPDRVTAITEALMAACITDLDKATNDAESRRNSIAALSHVVEELSKLSIISKTIDKDLFDRILKCVLNGLQDYTVDSRGDVGSWVREASLRALGICLSIGARVDNTSDDDPYVSVSTTRAAVGGACQQAMERIDRVREAAGNLLMTILWGVDGRLVVLERESFERVLPRNVDLNWLNAADVYPRLIQLLHVAEYRVELLVGITVSVGGLAESLIRQSTANLADLVNSLPTTSTSQSDFDLMGFFAAVLEIFARYPKQDRVILPLFEMLDVLFGVGAVVRLDEPKVFDQLYNATKNEVFKSRDAKKLLAAIKVFAGFASLGDQSAPACVAIRRRGLSQLVSYLIYPYPKVRRAASEQVYVVLSSDDVVSDAREEAETALLSTDWDQPVATLKTVKEGISRALNITSS
ncbi:hypothetical protein SmJEL517_g01309 [Synchytrium microbalum]|uniref:Tubulin-specific chaperone D n=1 Tax=Synchytrium microbalum TaxID=1806994 RepID=A0A507CGJ5_9FUNG|nr:uncharacterized protein SmJEL517_g01309 [Synchytrium microbalum]TPX36633.1 hypothetical protein SmJEL517_g01309 [Synchytrium microbalum]